jgi:protein gp37
MTKRLAGIESTKEKYSELINEGKNHFNGSVKLHDDELLKPLKWRKPRRVFVNSMSDLFHPSVPFEFIDRVFAVMAIAEEHTFQVLTKRPERMAVYFNTHNRSAKIMTQIDLIGEDDKFYDRAIDAAVNVGFNGLPLPNVWLGTSVENQSAADERIPYLLRCPSEIRFLSCEPLLGEVNFRWTDWAHKATNENYREYLNRQGNYNQYEGVKNIHWVIVGGESGPNARPIHPDWVRQIKDQCNAADIPFFFKQWGEYAPGSNDGVNEKLILKNGEVFRYPAPRELVMNLYSESEWNEQSPNVIHRAGKKKAGRLLFDKEWNQTPETL